MSLRINFPNASKTHKPSLWRMSNERNWFGKWLLRSTNRKMNIYKWCTRHYDGWECLSSYRIKWRWICIREKSRTYNNPTGPLPFEFPHERIMDSCALWARFRKSKNYCSNWLRKTHSRMSTSFDSFWDFWSTCIHDFIETGLGDNFTKRYKNHTFFSCFWTSFCWLGKFSERAISESSEKTHCQYSLRKIIAKICWNIYTDVFFPYRSHVRKLNRSSGSRNDLETARRRNSSHTSRATSWRWVCHRMRSLDRWDQSWNDGIKNTKEPLLRRRGSECWWIYGGIFPSDVLGERI